MSSGLLHDVSFLGGSDSEVLFVLPVLLPVLLPVSKYQPKNMRHMNPIPWLFFSILFCLFTNFCGSCLSQTTAMKHHKKD